jgi:phosphotransferase system enzyme I (PtsP)
VPSLRALRDISRKAAAHAKPVTVCGELASQPIGALALLAVGYRSFSVVPSAVGPVKAMLLDLDCGKVAAFIDPLLDGPAGVPVRDQLKAFAAAHGLQI